MTVFCGPSGSGKSSLAFDTLYAEGQRRYVTSLSAYARQFIGEMERPDVDKILGLSPVISIEQKTTSRNPRSTVGTITEIYDFLRLIFARIGEAYSYQTGKAMIKYNEEQYPMIAGVQGDLAIGTASGLAGISTANNNDATVTTQAGTLTVSQAVTADGSCAMMRLNSRTSAMSPIPTWWEL